jgi:hypothetical protein
MFPNKNDLTERIGGRSGKVSGTQVFEEAKRVYTDARAKYSRLSSRNNNNSNNNNSNNSNSFGLLQKLGELYMILKDIHDETFKKLQSSWYNGETEGPYTPEDVTSFRLTQTMFETMMKDRSMYNFIKRVDALKAASTSSSAGGSRRNRRRTRRSTRRNRTSRSRK